MSRPAACALLCLLAACGPVDRQSAQPLSETSDPLEVAAFPRPSLFEWRAPLHVLRPRCDTHPAARLLLRARVPKVMQVAGDGGSLLYQHLTPRGYELALRAASGAQVPIEAFAGWSADWKRAYHHDARGFLEVDTATGVEKLLVPGRIGGVLAAGDRTALLVGTVIGSVFVLFPETGELRTLFRDLFWREQTALVGDSVIHPDETGALSAWHRDGRRTQLCPGGGRVLDGPDGPTRFAHCDDATVRQWDVAATTLRTIASGVSMAAAAGDRVFLVRNRGTCTSELSVCDAASLDERALGTHEMKIRDLVPFRGGASVILHGWWSACEEGCEPFGKWALVDADAARTLYLVDGYEPRGPLHWQVSPEGTQVLLTGWLNAVLDAATGATVMPVAAYGRAFWSEDDRFLVTGESDEPGRVRVRDASTGRVHHADGAAPACIAGRFLVGYRDAPAAAPGARELTAWDLANSFAERRVATGALQNATCAGERVLFREDLQGRAGRLLFADLDAQRVVPLAEGVREFRIAGEEIYFADAHSICATPVRALASP